jgi:hypothetical protein
LASSVTNLGTVLVNDNTALTLRGAIKNSGTIFVDNVDFSADVHLFIDSVGVTLQGGGKVQLSNEFCNFITGVSSVTSSVLLNVDNTIPDRASSAAASRRSASAHQRRQARDQRQRHILHTFDHSHAGQRRRQFGNARGNELPSASPSIATLPIRRSLERWAAAPE